jgi:hypothetical protein
LFSGAGLMGLLDDEYRGAPEWQRQPANDRIHPWSGLLSQRNQHPDLPEGAPYPDAFSYPQPIPPGADDDRAYHPTLQWRDSAPGMREAEMMRRRRLALQDADTFRQPKTAAEVGIPEEEPSFQQKLDGMSMGEKLKMLLDDLLGRR